ncbi:MAG: hypothetical protein ACWGNV_13695, partial [Bacteroidales bacterium]
MARKKRRFLRIVGWIIAGFVSLVLIITLGFYLGRGWILKRAVTYLNKQQPGEITMGQINLIPLVNFPDVTLQLRNVNFYERAQDPDSLYQEPILSLNEILVRLDVVELIHKNVEVSEAKIEKGFIRYEIDKDSVSNLERALGIRFGEGPGEDTTMFPGIRVDLERLELSEILALMIDRTRDDRIELSINHLGSSFHYLPDRIQASLQLNMDINQLKYLTYSIETKRNILFESEVLLNPPGKEIAIEPSTLKVSGLELETWGSYSYSNSGFVDLAFRASNEGLEVLNYLFRGVLDLNEIEQVGAGKIYLSGNVAGELGDRLPVVRLNGTADRIGFSIKPIQKEVSDISFSFYATNGSSRDLSEAMIMINGFTATFPEGTIQGDFMAENMVKPVVDLSVQGEIDLTGLEKMLQLDEVDHLEGHVALEGNISGTVDRERGEFLNDSSYLHTAMNGVGVNYRRDSLTTDSIRGLNGNVHIQSELISTSPIEMEYNGNRMQLQAVLTQLGPYFMGFDREITADLKFASEEFSPGRILKDTSITHTLGEVWRDLHFDAGVHISSAELRKFLKTDTLPRMSLRIDSLGVRVPVYAELADFSVQVSTDPDTFALNQLKGTIGSSRLEFSGRLVDYATLLNNDSSLVIDPPSEKPVRFEFNLAGEMLKAGDLFTYHDQFMLPEEYRPEVLEHLLFSGDLELPAEELSGDTVLSKFRINVEQLSLKLGSYPLPIHQFLARIRREGNLLYIDELQGKVGESGLKLNAMVGNFTDTVLNRIYGNITLESDLLDINEIMAYPLPGMTVDTTTVRKTEETGGSAKGGLNQYEYPDLELNLDIGELRIDEYTLKGFQGKLRTSKEKIFFVDRLYTALDRGGSLEFDGQFNVSDPERYNLSTNFDVKDIDINGLDMKMEMGEETYTLRENFRGLVSANGLAEVFLSPEMSLDLPSATAVFSVKVVDGELINFTPLQAAAKYLDNKDLNHVRFATLENSFPLTLSEGKIIVPLTKVESTIGQMLIEGEQDLNGDYLYLLRLPTWLVRGAARSRLSAAGDDQKEDEILEYQS